MNMQKRCGIIWSDYIHNPILRKKYQVECDIHALEQKNMNIQEFYSTMTDIWDQLTLTESTELRAFAPYIARREEQRLV